MKDDDEYLWSGRGELDAETAKLERVLGQLRWHETKFSGAMRTRADVARKPRWMAAAAAAIVLGAIGTGIWMMQGRGETALTSWKMQLGKLEARPVRAGQVIETGPSMQGFMQSDFVGRVDIDPESRLRMLAAKQEEQRMALDYGTIHAFIWAPPAQFVVDTPASKAIDLGCRYTLQVTKAGDGFLKVEMGWVAFQAGATESFIPAGAACHTRRGRGPDTPYFEDASTEFVKQLANFDRTGSASALSQTLELARERDGLSLWHLLERTRGADRGAVFERLAELVPLPEKATREGVMRGDATSMNAAWDALKLGDLNWWRGWKRQW